MNFHIISKNKFIAELNRKDMEELDITYEEMDYSNIETRRVIWTIIDRIRDALGKDIDPSGNLLIEAVADTDGGCVLCFTVQDMKTRSTFKVTPPVLTKNTNSIVYEFENADTLLDMIKNVGAKNLSPKNSLYKKKNRFRLVLGCLPRVEDKKTIEEYGTFIGQDLYSMAQTKEHWEPAGKI